MSQKMARLPDGTYLRLTCRVIRNKEYGAARCVVSIGGAAIDGHAVVAGEERWISSYEDCVYWLTGRGLTETEAMAILALGNETDLPHNRQKCAYEVPSLLEQEAAGAYFEDVGRMVDGIEDDLKDRPLYTIDELVTTLKDCIRTCSYYGSLEQFAITCLKYSKNIASLFENDGHFIAVYDPIPTAFPFVDLAVEVMTMDCLEECKKRPWYVHLS